MKRTILTALITLFVSACSEAADQHVASDQAPASPSSFSAAEVDALHRAVLGVPANEIVQPGRSNPVSRNLEILRDRLDQPPRESDVERNMETLRRRIDPPSTAI